MTLDDWTGSRIIMGSILLLNLLTYSPTLSLPSSVSALACLLIHQPPFIYYSPDDSGMISKLIISTTIAPQYSSYY